MIGLYTRMLHQGLRGSILEDISAAPGALETLCGPLECPRLPHGGIQLALRVLLARRYPIQVENTDSPKLPQGVQWGPQGCPDQEIWNKNIES